MTLSSRRARPFTTKCAVSGTIKEIKKGATTSHVLLDASGELITASITNEAVDELKLAGSQKASTVIRASNVMILVE